VIVSEISTLKKVADVAVISITIIVVATKEDNRSFLQQSYVFIH